jgi:hypothetical protein
MDAVYDTAKLHALRRELEKLNEAAAKSGLIAPHKARPAAPAQRAREDRAGAEFADQGKAAARRLLAILGRIEGDVSPPISGTKFTEGGVVRLLAHLRKRSARAQRGNRFFRRLLAYLTRPVPMGIRTSAGVSVQRLQLVSRRLLEIEAHGWRHFQLMSAARRRRRRAPLSPKDRLAAPPITPRNAR